MKNLNFAFICSILFLGGCRSDDFPSAVRELDVARFCGRWYEVARLPNWFEDGLSDVTADYTLVGKDKIKVVNRGIKDGRTKEITGWARPAEKDGSGNLEVSFFRPFYSPYIVIKLAPDYSYSVVTGGSREYLWILSRTPELPPDVMGEILHFLDREGYDTSKLIMVNGG
jgi:apolipoprotein D and lipocalin family protein